MFTNTPSDRVQLVGLGELLSPAKCMICGSGVCEEGYARLGVWYDYEGEQYLCRTCVVQAAELFGCLTPEEAQHQQAVASDYATQFATAEEELTHARQRLAIYDSVIAAAASSLIPDDDGSAISSADEGSTGLTIELDEQTISESDSAESEPAESIEVEEPSGVTQPKLRNSNKPGNPGNSAIPNL